MRILVVSRYYPPDTDGVGDHAFHLTEALRQCGAVTKVLKASPGSPGSDSLSAPHWNQRLATQILQVALGHSINLVFWQYVPRNFASSGMAFWLPGVMQRLKRAGLRQAVFFHEVGLRTSGHGIRQSLLGHAQLAIARRMHQLADHSFTSIALYAKNFNKPQPVLVPISPNILPLHSGNKPGEKKLFCFTNRLTPTLLEALAPFDITLEVAGKATAGQVKWIAGHIGRTGNTEKVRLHGMLSAQALSTLLEGCSVMLQPEPVTHGEGGISLKNGTLAAALAHGLAVISECGDMTDPQLLQHGHNIWFVEGPGAAQWQKAIEHLLEHPDLLSGLGQNARDTFLRQLSWPVTTAIIWKELTTAG